VISSSQRPLPDNTQHSQQTDIHAPVGFEPTISRVERPQTYVLDRTATGTGTFNIRVYSIITLTCLSYKYERPLRSTGTQIKARCR
jgi:hypothetical protein